MTHLLFEGLVLAALLGAASACGGDGAMSHRDPNDPTNWNLEREDLGEPPPEGESGGESGEGEALKCDTAEYTPVTLELIEELGLSVEEWQKVQFFSGTRMVLQRGADSTEVEVTEAHAIRTADDKLVEEVVLECLTPGVLLEFSEREAQPSIMVAFDPAAPQSGLLFEATKSGRKRGGFCLALWTTPDVHVMYEGKAYEPTEADTCLLIKTESAEDIRKQARQLPGIQLE